MSKYMIFEGRTIENNGCRHHSNCLTCPKDRCVFDVIEEDVTPEVAERRAKHNAYYHRNKERILAGQRKRRIKKNGKSNNSMQCVYEG